jgi:DNA-binding response OmpR family regulator
LVIDDESDICLLIGRILKTQGIDCDCAQSIKQAKIKTNGNNYELFIIDVNLPDGTGLDLISNITEENNYADIVIISAHDDTETVEKALRFGAKKFIKKPFSKAEILELV